MTTRETVAQARYNIFTDKLDGRQEMFIKNFPEEPALYTQQVLSNYFSADEPAIGASRLADNAPDTQIDDIDLHEEAMMDSASLNVIDAPD
ncbi:MAG: hypothetical protein AAFR81_08815 [Chloroflexota bacterium]